MIEKLKHKYALSSKGAKDMVRAFVAVTLSNLVLMLPVGLLYVLSAYLLDQQLPKEKFTFFFHILYFLRFFILNARKGRKLSFSPLTV